MKATREMDGGEQDLDAEQIGDYNGGGARCSRTEAEHSGSAS